MFFFHAAFPDSSPILLRDPVIAVVGETARLQCGIQPGALAGQYFARWFNGTSQRTLYDYPAPSQRSANPSLEISEGRRYNINRSDLSLMISNVQRNDSFENYRCEVGVEDPRSPSRTTYFYELTRNHNIGLKVVGEYKSNTSVYIPVLWLSTSPAFSSINPCAVKESQRERGE